MAYGDNLRWCGDRVTLMDVRVGMRYSVQKHVRDFVLLAEYGNARSLMSEVATKHDPA